MGADGHIVIWRDDVVRREFPECDELFWHLPNHYAHELDGVLYHHCYGDERFLTWWSDVDAIMQDTRYSADGTRLTFHAHSELRKRLGEFVSWLQQNGTNWEVWT